MRCAIAASARNFAAHGAPGITLQRACSTLPRWPTCVRMDHGEPVISHRPEPLQIILAQCAVQELRTIADWTNRLLPKASP